MYTVYSTVVVVHVVLRNKYLRIYSRDIKFSLFLRNKVYFCERELYTPATKIFNYFVFLSVYTLRIH